MRLLKKIVKRIPGATSVFHLARCRAVLNVLFRVRPWLGERRRTCEMYFCDLRGALSGYLKSDAQKRQRKRFVASVENWNFDHPFVELVQCAAHDHDYVERTGYQLIKENKYNPKGYALIQACCDYKPKAGHYDVGLHSLAVGCEIVSQGRLKEARSFFQSLQKIFPEVYEPYAILYDILYEKQEAYRAAPAPIRKGQKKRLLLSFVVWGDQYIRFFNDYCLPCLMAPGNLPAVAHRRDIAMDIYAHREDIEKLKKQEMVLALSAICNIHYIEFPKRLIECEGYKRYDSAFRYNIYGGFHHLSIERARAIEADVMCLGPDNLYSDGSFLNYVELVDQGYSAVLFTATRAQAEPLEPIVRAMKDPVTHALSISADDMVRFSTQYIHHAFLEYIVTGDKVPVWRSAYFVPYKNGLRIRCFHYHPVIIAASAIHRSRDLVWNYTTVDGTLITALFPDRKDWDTMTLITDSKDGIMLDMAYASSTWRQQEHVPFTQPYLDTIRANFNDNQFWNFKFTVDYRMEQEITGVRGYRYDKDNGLEPVEFPLTATIENIGKQVDDWYHSRSLEKR